uniref:Uncharacterized protein n=1 Tax=viral metagenome TaxID=1070528 RepID=A0A6M3KWM8_9ZZZZ
MGIYLYTRNILENGTVTVTGGDPDTGYPVARLYDRYADLSWKCTTGSDYKVGPMGGDTYSIGPMGGDTYEIGDIGQTFNFQIQQEANNQKFIDTLLIAGHNFDGRLMKWQYSDDGAEWTDALSSWTQDGNALIVKSISELNKPFWRVNVYNAVDPVCGEIVMSLGQTFPVMYAPNPAKIARPNIAWSQSIGGTERGIKYGGAKREWDYQLNLISTELTTFETAMDDLSDLTRPFFVKDHLSTYMLVRFIDPPAYNFKSIADSLQEIPFFIKEL